MPILGAHVSTAGGTPKAFQRGRDIGCDALQIFVKSPNQWRGRTIPDDEVAEFRALHAAEPLAIVAHGAYLINLASPKEEVLEKSKAALLDELQRCTRLGLIGLVVHPGAHLGEGADAGIERIARAIDEVLASDESLNTKLILENTAGQGTTLGAKFSELAGIIELVCAKDQLAVCLDSCHAFAAGYDLSTEDGYQSTFEEFDATVGLSRLACLHLNDSKHPLGSRKDRHDNIGEGLIGIGAFARFVNDPRLGELPMVLETPLGDDELGHKRDLETLRSLL